MKLFEVVKDKLTKQQMLVVDKKRFPKPKIVCRYYNKVSGDFCFIDMHNKEVERIHHKKIGY